MSAQPKLLEIPVADTIATLTDLMLSQWRQTAANSTDIKVKGPYNFTER